MTNKLDNFIDAHIHFNKKSYNPAEDLCNYLKTNNLFKCLLIINSSLDFKYLLQAISLDKNILGKLFFSFGLNIHDDFINDFVNFCKTHNAPLSIKLHPRLNNMAFENENWYIDKISDLEPRVIIIDDFLYGNKVPFDYSIHLVEILAKKFFNSNIILAHSGGVELLKHVMATKIYSNVYYDISLTINYLSNSSIDLDLGWLIKFMHKRVLLGSDYPDFTFKQAYDNVKRIFQINNLSEDFINEIAFENINNVFRGEKCGR